MAATAVALPSTVINVGSNATMPAFNGTSPAWLAPSLYTAPFVKTCTVWKFVIVMGDDITTKFDTRINIFGLGIAISISIHFMVCTFFNK